MLRIWVVNSEEPIPALTGKGRLMRGGTLAECFSSDADNDVTWWCSTFLHYEKRFYDTKPVSVDLKKNLHLRMLHTGKAYTKHISPARIRYCRLLAKELKKAIRKEENPDVIYCAWPNIEPAYECVRYGKQAGVPVVIDIRDLWPDIFVRHFRGIMKAMAGAVVNVMYGRRTRYVMRNADKVIAVHSGALELAGKYGRKTGKQDHPVYISVRRNTLCGPELEEAESFWMSQGIVAGDFLVVYIGTITEGCLYRLIAEAARTNHNADVKFVICGNGTYYGQCAALAKGCGRIVFPGFVNLAQMTALCKRSGLGLLPYRNRSDLVDAFPTKFSEYLSFGLPVLTTLRGASREKLEENHCGMYFNTAEELNRIIDRYASDEAFWAAQSGNARRLFEAEFNADHTYRGLLDEMRGLLPDSAGGR